MKYFLFFLCLFFLVSCKDGEEFIYDFPEIDKLLVSVTRTGSHSEFRAEFKYDSLNRLTGVKNFLPELQTATETYVYDEMGRMVEKRNGNYTTTFSYNKSGQIVEQNLHYFSPENENEWNQKTEYKYKNGKINKGIIYSEEGEIQNYISYKYDSRGNTLEKAISVPGDNSSFKLSETKFRYDSKVNPFTDSGVTLFNGYTYIQDADIKQVNNPVYSFFMNAVMSSLPPEFEISYEYDLDGLPVSAVLNNVRFPEQEPVNIVYEYRDIEK